MIGNKVRNMQQRATRRIQTVVTAARSQPLFTGCTLEQLGYRDHIFLTHIICFSYLLKRHLMQVLYLKNCSEPVVLKLSWSVHI